MEFTKGHRKMTVEFCHLFSEKVVQKIRWRYLLENSIEIVGREASNQIFFFYNYIVFFIRLEVENRNLLVSIKNI